MDGKVERTNVVMEEVLRCYCFQTQNDWALFLPSTEFAINSSHSEAISMTPFMANYWFEPVAPWAVAPSSAMVGGVEARALVPSLRMGSLGEAWLMFAVKVLVASSLLVGSCSMLFNASSSPPNESWLVEVCAAAQSMASGASPKKGDNPSMMWER